MCSSNCQALYGRPGCFSPTRFSGNLDTAASKAPCALLPLSNSSTFFRNASEWAILFSHWEVLYEEIGDIPLGLSGRLAFVVVLDLDDAFNPQLIHLLLEKVAEARMMDAGSQISRRRGSARARIEEEDRRVVRSQVGDRRTV